MAARVKRRTARTDANGNVLEEFRGLYAETAISDARKAGVPRDLLDRAGWNGDEDDTRGFFAEQIYRLGEVNFTAPDAIEQIGRIIDVMQRLCRSLGVDPKAAIPYDMARFKRQLHETRERLNAIDRREDRPLATLDDLGITWPVTW